VASVHVGTPTDRERYLRQLDSTTPLSALELALAGRQGFIESHVDQVGVELIQSLAALLDVHGAGAVADRAFDSASEILERDPGLLARSIVQAADEGLLDEEDVLRVTLALAGRVTAAPPPSDVAWSRLHRASPILATALDVGTDDVAVIARWEEELGWDGMSGWPERGAPVHRIWLEKTSDELRQIRQLLDVSATGPLSYGGMLAAMFEWLQSRQDNGDDRLTRWTSAYRCLADRRVHDLSPAHAQYLDAVTTKDPIASALGQFPRDVLAAAIHLVSIPRSAREALAALLDAATFAPALVIRSVVLALVLERGLPSPE
jgi:hypothetical protein